MTHDAGDDPLLAPTRHLISETALGNSQRGLPIDVRPFGSSGVDATIRTVGHLGQLSDADFKDTMLVATVTATGNYPLLGLVAGEEDSLFLQLDAGGTWSATMVEYNNRHKDLFVAHYTYPRGINGKDFPGAARWDTSRVVLSEIGPDSVTIPVIGLRCGKAWCLVGGSTVDKDDPEYIANSADKPWAARVRGWSDYKPNGAGGLMIAVAKDGIDTLTKKDFKTDFIPVASLYNTTTHDTAAILMHFDTVSKAWQVKFQRDGYQPVVKTIATDKYRRHKELVVPGVTRWDASPVGPLTQQRSGSARAMAIMGDLWIRCASGCCETDAEMPSTRR